MPLKLRFRKTLKIAPGVKVNLSKSGVSTSVGGKHARVRVGGARGTQLSAGAGPVRYEKQVTTGKRRRWWLLWLA